MTLDGQTQLLASLFGKHGQGGGTTTRKGGRRDNEPQHPRGTEPQAADFSRQYYGVYKARLNQLRPSLLLKAEDKWPEPVTALADLRDRDGGRCVIVGTLYKRQTLKPTILKELADDLNLLPEPKRKNFVDESDRLILEDELQRIRLVGDVLDIGKMVTGVVCAILGSENEDGMFKIVDYCFADLPPLVPPPPLENDECIAIVSGLNLCSAKNNDISLRLMMDWLTGSVGSDEERSFVSKITRVIIAGNSIGNLPSDCDPVANSYDSASSSMSDSLKGLQKLDDILCELCQSVEIDLMPGEFDPTNIMLPQNPMHYCMFPKASQLSSFKGGANPYECEIKGRTIIGSAGQPVHDILRYTTIDSEMNAAKSTLEWCYMAPTAPDTLPCVPSFERDPFVIDKSPHIFFSGNAESFATDIYKGPQDQTVRVICVPQFSSTHTIALINLKTLDCFPISFQINSC